MSLIFPHVDFCFASTPPLWKKPDFPTVHDTRFASMLDLVPTSCKNGFAASPVLLLICLVATFDLQLSYDHFCCSYRYYTHDHRFSHSALDQLPHYSPTILPVFLSRYLISRWTQTTWKFVGRNFTSSIWRDRRGPSERELPVSASRRCGRGASVDTTEIYSSLYFALLLSFFGALRRRGGFLAQGRLHYAKVVGRKRCSESRL